MDATGVTGKVYQACQWISRLAYLNLLWLLFMGLGLIVFGVTPSTVAMFTIIRKWLQGEKEFPIFLHFFQVYKKEFWSSNRLGLILLVFTLLLFVDWMLIGSLQGFLYPILLGCFIGVAFLFTIVILYIFPVFVHFEHRTFQYVKVAFLLGISYPLYSFVMLLAVICVVTLSVFFNGVGLLFFGSGISYILMYISTLLFHKVAQKFGVEISRS